MGKSLLPSHFAVNPKCAKKIKPQKHMKEKKGLTLLLRVGRGRGAVHSASQRGEDAGVLSMVPGRVGRGQVYYPGCLAEGDGAGVLWPGCLSEWGKGRGAVSTVPLQVEAGRGPVHGTSQSGRAWGTVSTVPLTVGGMGYCVHSTSHSWGGAVSTVSLRAGGRRGAVSTVSHSRGVQGSCGARSRPLAPGGAGSGGAVSCQAHHTASPFAVSCLALPASILWHLFQKTCLLPPTLSPRLF